MLSIYYYYSCCVWYAYYYYYYYTHKCRHVLCCWFLRFCRCVRVSFLCWQTTITHKAHIGNKKFIYRKWSAQSMLDEFSSDVCVYVLVAIYLVSLGRIEWYSHFISSHLISCALPHIIPFICVLCNFALVHILSHQLDKNANWHWHCSLLHITAQHSTSYHTEHMCAGVVEGFSLCI